MNTYTYEEIAIGQKESFTAALTAEQMEQFRQITGDDNPLHIGVAVIESTPGGGGGGAFKRAKRIFGPRRLWNVDSVLPLDGCWNVFAGYAQPHP